MRLILVVVALVAVTTTLVSGVKLSQRVVSQSDPIITFYSNAAGCSGAELAHYTFTSSGECLNFIEIGVSGILTINGTTQNLFQYSLFNSVDCDISHQLNISSLAMGSFCSPIDESFQSKQPFTFEITSDITSSYTLNHYYQNQVCDESTIEYSTGIEPNECLETSRTWTIAGSGGGFQPPVGGGSGQMYVYLNVSGTDPQDFSLYYFLDPSCSTQEGDFVNGEVDSCAVDNTWYLGGSYQITKTHH